MEYQLYENSDILLNQNPSISKSSWNIASDNSMDENNDEYFGWSSLNDEKFEHSKSSARKRKLSANTTERKIKQPAIDSTFKIDKDTLVVAEEKSEESKKASKAPRMPHWQVEDYGDLNAEIDSSLSLGSDLDNNAYTVSDSILSINGIVYKQEVPSPTSNDMALVRQAHQSPTSTIQETVTNNNIEDSSQNMFNTTINQLLSQSGLVNLNNVMDSNLSSPNSQSYNVSSTNFNLIEDCRFQYVLAAATSIATKQNEDTLTYLNQGQSYEIKLKKLGDLSMYRGKMLKSVIRICFHERRLQYMEKEQISLWQRARPGDRILEVDIPLSYGAFDVIQSSNVLNVISFSWDPTKEVGVYIKVNCISTEFTPKKHGGEKGVPFRIQVETYQSGEPMDNSKRLHAAACQIKVFKLKGADRKHKQDRDKIMKRPISEQEKYQPSYECTVLNDIANDAVLSSPPLIAPAAVECTPPTNLNQNQLIQKVENDPVPNRSQKTSVVISQQLAIANETVDTKEEIEHVNSLLNEPLSASSSPENTCEWLTANRFGKYLQTFSSFSGADMLRMTREDLIQICKNADGIRLYNALHSKAIAPRLKIYVCKENSSVFNAIFLSAHSNSELLQKLTTMIGLPQDQVRDIYMEGPQCIHVQINNDVIRHIKEDTMFSLEVMQDSGQYILLLKRAVK